MRRARNHQEVGEEGVKTIMICQTSVVMTGGDWGTISSRKEDMGDDRVLY